MRNPAAQSPLRLARYVALATLVAGSAATPSRAVAAATCDPGWTTLGGGRCELVLNYNGTATTMGTVQFVNVPAGVNQMQMVAAGAEGQASLDWGTGTPSLGGLGGRQTGTVTVIPGATLHVYVGQRGATVPVDRTVLPQVRGWVVYDPFDPNIYNILGAFGGGGLTTSDMGGFGGGGSFVFDDQPILGDPAGAIGNLLVAAGGGGGGGTDYNQVILHGGGPMKNVGGAGSGAVPATDGSAAGLTQPIYGLTFSAGGGTGGNQLGGGSPGTPSVPVNYFLGQVSGWPGGFCLGLPDTLYTLYLNVYLGAGGGTQMAGNSYNGYAGAGGGGYGGGGGGGSIESQVTGGGGGGGSGFIDPGATGTIAEVGVWKGDGQVILRYDLPAAPTVTTLSPASGPVGTTVTITGTNLATTSAVSFGGALATFKVVSATQVTAVVPVGAKTGPISVVNASGSAASASTFTVTVVPTTLSALKVSAGAIAPAFASATVAYTASVAYAVATTTVTATATNTAATLSLSVNGGAFLPLTSSAQSLLVGANRLVVRVTAPDSTFRDYTVTITRAAPSTVTTLAGFTTTAGAISPAFAAATLAYTSTTTATATTATVTATVTAGSGATVKYQVGSTTGTWTAFTSGVASPALPLVAGASTTIYVRVTAQDGVTSRTYSLLVNRVAPSTVKTLSALKLSAGTLAPKFAATTLTYATTVPAATASYTVTATVTAASGATLAYQVGATGAWVQMISAKATAAIPAVTGTTPVRIRVTAQDKSFQDYVVNVTR